jgi:hypothetical protein
VTTGTSQSDSRKRSERRRRDDVIQVRVTEAELEAISANAAAANLTTAEFLRRLGQGYTPKSKVDLTVGRLGGLLKLWLADKRAGATALTDELAIKDINELWRDIQKTYGALKEKVEEL